MAAQLAFLLQDALDPAITDESLTAQLLADWPDLDPSRLTTGDPRERAETAEDGPVIVHYDGTMIALMSVPAPVGDDLAEIAQHSRLWPKDAPVPVDYGAHTVVSAFTADAAGHEALVAQAALLSKAVSSLIALSESIRAVYWGAAAHVILPALFRDLALSTLPAPLLPAWVALNVGARPDGVLTGHSLGLDQLGVKDIEIPQSPEDAASVLDRLAGIAEYQLQHGPVIGDGDTIGSVSDAEVVARHQPSAIGDERIVLSLSFIGTEPAPVKKKGFFRRR